ncbi:uncharacterized protein LOC113275851 isoform X2 [Papaver somniferum]|uniref:uncharacterized protein LOC113275851 isoform X2 n=1 Tax=Papaver somniferum TaxID=3469 RepID=UPI000E7007AD|nr:uncharacterized protein LOC113275851 isoform X2 [Papaver somniferum]XP_026381201.1 uncharacterized protein LOC113275851 isoform X2 [Papaver somniferum]
MCPYPNILRLVAVVAVSQKLQMKLSLLKMWTIFSWKTPKKMNVTQLRIQKLLQYMTVMKTLSMGQMNNNFSESFNNMINKMRNKPIIMIGIMYANLVMGTWYNRRTESASWVDGNLVPTAVTLIKKMLEFVTDYGVDPCVAGELYMVTSPKNSVFTVNILAKTCSCLQWQLRGFPCMHAVSALHSIRPQWRKYCSDYYSVENYKATYAPTFAPLDDKSEWVQQ